MPVLPKERKIIRVNLTRFPTDDPGWIDIVERASVAEMEAVENLSTGERPGEATQSLMLLASLIRDWNFTEEDGSKATISIETVRRLELRDILDLQAAIQPATEGMLTTEKKRESPGTSSPKQPVSKAQK